LVFWRNINIVMWLFFFGSCNIDFGLVEIG
jgi:hypothetical protein